MTTLRETVATIEAEGLDRFAYVIGDDHGGSADALVLTRRDGCVALGDDHLRRPDCLAVARRDGAWSTFYVDERAAVEERSLHTFPDEVSAVADFLDRLRSQHRKLEIQDELRNRRRRAGEPS